MNDRMPEIQGWFVPRIIPAGRAPESIREQWIGVPLPLRNEARPRISIGHAVGDVTDIRVIVGGAEVVAFDAVKLLRIFERPYAADFWQEEVKPLRTLVFRRDEGQFYSPLEILRILPGIDTFDDLEPRFLL